VRNGFVRAVYSRDLKIVPPNNPIDLQLFELIDFHLLRWSAQQRLFCVVGACGAQLFRPGGNR